MKRTKMIIMLVNISLITLIIFTGCTSQHGNPLELSGKWSQEIITSTKSSNIYSYDTSANFTGDQKIIKSYDYAFTDNGTYTLTLKSIVTNKPVSASQAAAAGFSNQIITITENFEGNFTGNVYTTDKTITINEESDDYKAITETTSISTGVITSSTVAVNFIHERISSTSTYYIVTANNKTYLCFNDLKLEKK